jgi:hypothetical protein
MNGRYKMRSILAFLALIVAGVLFAGIAAAQPPLDLETIIVDVLETPAFAVAYGDADAYASWDPTDRSLGKLSPYTVAQTLVYDPTGAENMWVDPTSSVNMTAISISGLGAGTLTTAAIKDGSQEWQSYATAAGIAQGETSGIQHAWTVGISDVDTEVDPTFSSATATSVIVSVADFEL